MAARALRITLALALVVLAAFAMPGSTEASFLTETKKLSGSDTEAGDKFGAKVAVSGDTALVGASREDAGGSNAGAAYVLQRHVGGADNWGEVKKLTASEAEAGDFFGNSVAVDADTAVVGAIFEDASGLDAGAAYVFQRNQGGTDNWGEVTKLTASDAEAGDRFGFVAVSGGTAVVGAFWEDAGGNRAGAAYIFQRNEGGADNWGEVAKLTASDAQAGDIFGQSAALNGDVAIMGANGEDAQGGSAGAAYIFGRDQGGQNNWGEVKKLTASDAQANDWFGTGVAVSGDTAVVGANREDTGGFTAGAAYFFQRDQGGQDNWGEVSKLAASDAEAGDRFGTSLDVDGDIALVGTFGDNAPGNIGGAAYLFDLLGPKSTPTSTPTLPPPPPGDGAAMSLRVDVSQQTGCPGGPQQGKVCVGLGQKFDVTVVADAVPLTNGYWVAQAWIDYDDQGLVRKNEVQPIWPGCFSAGLFISGEVPTGSWVVCENFGIRPLPSFYLGDLFSFSFTCSNDQSSSDVQILPRGDPAVGDSGAYFLEFDTKSIIVPTVSGITVNCVPCPPPGCQTPTPTPTPTPGPLPVGGFALDSGLRPVAALEPEAGGGYTGWLVAGSVAIAAALAAGAASVVWKRSPT